MSKKDSILNNVLIALSAGALFWKNNLFSTDTATVFFTLAVIFVTFSAYSFLRNSFSRKISIAISVAGAAIIGFFYPNIPQPAFALTAFVLLLAYPFFRKITGVKNLCISLVWALVCSFNLHPEENDFYLRLFSVAAWIFSLSIISDLLDFHSDKNDIKTIPHSIGYYAAFAISALFAGVADFCTPHTLYWHTILWVVLLLTFLIKQKTIIYHAVEVSSVILVILQFLSFFYDKS